MRRTTKIIAAVFLVAIIGLLAALVILPQHPANPVYAGRRLSDWVRNWGPMELAPGFGSSFSTNVTTLDSNAAPYLVSILRRHDGPWEKWYRQNWPKFPAWLQQRLPRPVYADERSFNAIIMLGGSGPGSRETIAALLDVAEGKINVPSRAGSGFRTQSLFSGHQEAVFCLGKIGTNNPLAIEGLFRLLNEDTNRYTNAYAVGALGMIGGRSQSAVELLVRRACTGKSGVSIFALQQMGHQGHLGVQGLARVYRESGDSNTCTNVLGALQELVPEQPEAMDALVSFVRHADKPGGNRWDEMMVATRAKDPNSAGMRAVIAVALDDNEDIGARSQAWQVMEFVHGRTTASLYPDRKPRKTVDVIAEIRDRANAELESLNARQGPSTK